MLLWEKNFNELDIDFRFTTQYKTMIGESAAKLQFTSGDMQSAILDISRTSFKEYMFQYLTAASVAHNETIVAWYNGQPLHAAALSLELVHNALIKTKLGNEYGIRVTNHPLPYFREKKSDTRVYDSFGSVFPYIIAVMMSVYSASYVIYLIKVRRCQSYDYFILKNYK